MLNSIIARNKGIHVIRRHLGGNHIHEIVNPGIIPRSSNRSPFTATQPLGLKPLTGIRVLELGQVTVLKVMGMGVAWYAPC